MKQKIGIMFFVFLFCFTFIAAETYEETYATYSDISSSSVQVESLKYEPYPVNPSEYFTLWISAKKTGSGTSAVTFELMPIYPFSLDSNEEAIREFGALMGENVLLEYKIRVDQDAVVGTNEIELRYKLDSSSTWISKSFDITINDAQTSFDGVIQDIEGSAISLALANTGKNIANSVIVKIPEQENFVAIGTAGQMVGNLDDGDYTIVGFDVNKIQQSTGNIIIFQIDYTDNIGERRSEYLELVLDLSKTMIVSSGELPAGFPKSGSKSGIPSETSNTWIWIVGGLVIILLIFRKKIFGLFRKNK